jgi:CRP-like cAMP-binding protein
MSHDSQLDVTKRHCQSRIDCLDTVLNLPEFLMEHFMLKDPDLHRSEIKPFSNPDHNHLLNALPAAEYKRIAAGLELIPLMRGEVLLKPGDMMRHVYFPTTSILSLWYVKADGSSVETAIVGNEGMLGISLLVGGETMPSWAVVQSAGYAYRLKSELLKRNFASSVPLWSYCCAMLMH